MVTLLLIFALSIVGTTGSALAFPGLPTLPPLPGTPPTGLPTLPSLPGTPPDMEQFVKNCLDKLVTAGTIKQDQADKASNYLKQNKFDPKNFDPQKMVSDLKNMGLTDKQAQDTTDAFRLPKPPSMSSDMEQPVESELNKLVTSGTITQDQADKANNYLKQNKFDPKNFDPQEMVSELGNIGITDKQAQAIIDAIRPSTGVV